MINNVWEHWDITVPLLLTIKLTVTEPPGVNPIALPGDIVKDAPPVHDPDELPVIIALAELFVRVN